MANAINWFEIPATDFKRAKEFYSNVLDAHLQDSPDPSREYAFLPADPQKGEIGGAIASGQGYEVGTKGSIVYLNAGDDLAPALSRVESSGGQIILPKTEIGGGMGFMALFIDSEGNKVGFHSMQ